MFSIFNFSRSKPQTAPILAPLKSFPFATFGKKAFLLRKNIPAHKSVQKPESMMDVLLPQHKDIFKPVLGKTQSVRYRGMEFQVKDFGDYIRFRPKGREGSEGERPERARIFFHGLMQNRMDLVPGFPDAKKYASYDKHYRKCLSAMDAQNVLSGIDNNKFDIVWHRGFWGGPNDKSLIAHNFISENMNPLFRRGFVDNAIQNFAKDDIEKLFGKNHFAPDIFARSGALMMDRLQKDYQKIDVVTHSMGNATFLEALEILEKDTPNKANNSAKFSALLTHPVPSANNAVHGAYDEFQKHKAYDELLKYVQDIAYKVIGNKSPEFRDRNFLSGKKIAAMLQKAVQDGKLTVSQRRIILRGMHKAEEAITKGQYSLDPMNHALKQAFPLMDERLMRSKIHTSWQLPFPQSVVPYLLNDSDPEKSRLSIMMALQPFCVGPFFDGKAENILDRKIGTGQWKVFAGGKDSLAPQPEKFLNNIFHFQKPKNHIVLPKMSLTQQDIKDVLDKKIVIVQTGGHSTPVIRNNVLHPLMTQMYQAKEARISQPRQDKPL